MKRPLTRFEKSAIRKVAEKLPKDKQEILLADMNNALAESILDDASRVMFYISGYERPPYRGQHSFGIEGELYDKDGTKLSFDLYADENNRILEMDIIRWGEGRVIAPDWATLKLYGD